MHDCVKVINFNLFMAHDLKDEVSCVGQIVVAGGS